MALTERFILDSPLLGQLILKDTPEGWDSPNQLSFSRDSDFQGVFQNYTVNVVFYGDAKDYIKQVYDQQGIEGLCVIHVEQRDPMIRRFRPEFKGRANFNTYKYNDDDESVSVNIEESSFAQAFKNGDEIDHALTGHISATTHSRAVPKKYKASGSLEENPNDFNTFDVSQGTSIVERTHTRYLQFAFDQIEYQELLDTFTYPNAIIPSLPGEVYTVQESGVHNISFGVRFQVTFNTKNDRNIKLKPLGCNRGDADYNDAHVELIFEYNGVEEVIAEHHNQGCLRSWEAPEINHEFNRKMTLSPGDTIRIYAKLTLHAIYDESIAGGSRLQIDTIAKVYAGNSIFFDGLSVFTKTSTRGILVFEALQQLAEKMTGQPDSFKSDFFGRTDSSPSYSSDGPGSKLLVTNGFQIRGFPILDKPIVENWRDLFGSLNNIFNLGVGIEVIDGVEKIVVEPKEHFFDKANIIADLGFVEDLEEEAETELIYNKVDVSYRNWEIESVQGLDEFNSRRTYSLPITQTKKTLQLEIVHIAGGYRIEFSRRKTFATTADEDHKDDDNKFLIVLMRRLPNSWEAESDQPFETVGNIQSPSSAYNIRLSPGRILLNWLNVLSASIVKIPDREVTFSFGEGNYLAFTKLLSETAIVNENASYPLSQLPTPLWLPEVYNFNATANYTVRIAIRRNPYGMIKFKNKKGQDRYGFIDNVSFTKTENKGTFRLRRAK